MRARALLAFLFFPFSFSNLALADSSSQKENDPSSLDNKKFYWQNTKLYNQGRLSEPYEGFENTVQGKQNTKESEAYLTRIRQDMVKSVRDKEKERQGLNYQGDSAANPLQVTYLEKGHIRVTLLTQYLFDENTAALNASSMDVLNRLAALLDSKAGSQIELTMSDQLENNTRAKELDAERALVVFSLLNLKKIAAANAIAG